MNDIFNQLFDFDDILIEPAIFSKINSRTEINSRNIWNMLPLMTAPMDTVINENNFHIYFNNGIIPVYLEFLNQTVNGSILIIFFPTVYKILKKSF